MPILMVTAKQRSDDVIAGINGGARYYVTKPFTTASLVEHVRHALARRHGRRPR